MSTYDPETLSRKIKEALSRPRAVLFCGAGVGVRVGLPTWKQYVMQLAQVCEKYNDKTAAQLIRERIDDDDYPGAATIYKTCRRIPTGELHKELGAPFRAQPKADEIERIVPLIKLKPTAIVTTNYDRSLHHAYSHLHRTSPLPIEIDDASLSTAAVLTEFFVARIHGRAEEPQTMILDTRDYENLEKNDKYEDFLIPLLTQRPCIFVGFSFADPAINNVLSIFKKRVGPNFPTLHLAILPDSAKTTLGTALHQVNIERAYYTGDDNHKDLWRAIGQAAKDEIAAAKIQPDLGTMSVTHSSFQRFLAFTYAQLKSRPHQQPVLEIAQDGMVRSLINQAGRRGITEDILSKNLREALHLTGAQAYEVVHASLVRLIADGDVDRQGETITRSEKDGAPLFDEHMGVLASAVMDRMKVREGVTPTDSDERAAKSILESVFMARAWDLAAHYAGSSAGFAADLPTVISAVVREHQKSHRVSNPVAMEYAVGALLSAPDNKEATLLAELGRSAFAVQLVLSSPRQALFQKFSLPQKVYFDTNVLLPAITDGHPMRPAYSDTISRLRNASIKLGNQCELCVGHQFLNEIISHRDLAIQTVRQLGLEDRKALGNHISLYGATNTNIFIGAYSSHVGRTGTRKLSFSTFLHEMAPYKTESELAGFLRARGFTIIGMGTHAVFGSIFARLLADNEQFRNTIHAKEKILIQHEAQQLAQLHVDSEKRLRTVFVTADHRLQRLLASDFRLRGLSGTVLSQLSFMGLVDIMVGLDVDKRSFVRLIWGSSRTETKQLVRDYLIKRALEAYDVGMTMAMPEVVNKIAEEAAAEARKKNIDLFSASSPGDVAKTAKFMDRMEENFFSSMREAIQKEENS